MVDEAQSPEIYVFTIDAVRRSIGSLLNIKTHEHLAGYLALLRSRRTRGADPSQLSDIVEFFDRYLAVPKAGENRPYLRPFVWRGTNVWFNDNISGSYAPSNVKVERGPFFKVVDVVGTGRSTTYSLPDNHVARASQHLFKGHKLPVAALTAFIYRDYGLQLAVPSISAAVNLFREEFCLRATEAKEDATFGELFYNDTDNFNDADIELLKEAANG